MSIGDLVSVVAPAPMHLGIIIDLYDPKEPDGEARILWDDGKIYWERLSQLQRRTEVINEGR